MKKLASLLLSLLLCLSLLPCPACAADMAESTALQVQMDIPVPDDADESAGIMPLGQDYPEEQERPYTED